VKTDIVKASTLHDSYHVRMVYSEHESHSSEALGKAELA
jgi:hypothetical protein